MESKQKRIEKRKKKDMKRKRRWCLLYVVDLLIFFHFSSLNKCRIMRSRFSVSSFKMLHSIDSSDFSTWTRCSTRNDLETHRDKVACRICCTDESSRVAKYSSWCVGGDKVSEDHDKCKNHLNTQTFPWWNRLWMRNRGLQISLISWQWNSVNRKKVKLIYQVREQLSK